MRLFSRKNSEYNRTTRNKPFFFVMLFLTGLLSLVYSHLYAHSIPNNNSLAPMLKNVLPTVVQITIEKKDETTEPSFSPNPTNNTPDDVAIGTGIIINAKDGVILTNAHVVADAKRILVTLKNGSRYFGHLVAIQKDHDIAIIHIQAEHLQALPLASMRDVHVGDFVAAIGTPFGLSQSVTTGTISALNRTEPHIGNLPDLMQTDAAVNPGNSGGPLINMQGQLVGMNTALIGPGINIGLGFAIPVDIIQSVASQLIQYGNIKSGMLGVIAQPLSGNLALAMHATIHRGTLVTEVMPSSAAAKAHIKPGDIITSINGQPIYSALALKTTVALFRPGTKISIKLMRDNQPVTVRVTLQSIKNAMAHIPSAPFVSGLQLQSVHEFTLSDATLNGLLITHVNQDSSAFLAGAQPGDILTAINEKPTSDINTLRSILAQIPGQQNQVLAKVYRDGKRLMLALSRA